MEIKNENKTLSSDLTDGQRFVACGTHVPIDNFDQISEDQLKSLPYFQNYVRGNPSKVSIKTFHYFEQLITYKMLTLCLSKLILKLTS